MSMKHTLILCLLFTGCATVTSDTLMPQAYDRLEKAKQGYVTVYSVQRLVCEPTPIEPVVCDKVKAAVTAYADGVDTIGDVYNKINAAFKSMQ